MRSDSFAPVGHLVLSAQSGVVAWFGLHAVSAAMNIVSRARTPVKRRYFILFFSGCDLVFFGERQRA